jgi:transcription elongation factor Elf1
MSKRCELQKEYYKSNGNYKGVGKYNDKYVKWLEDQILQSRYLSTIVCTVDRCMSCEVDIKQNEGLLFCGDCYGR